MWCFIEQGRAGGGGVEVKIVVFLGGHFCRTFFSLSELFYCYILRPEIWFEHFLVSQQSIFFSFSVAPKEFRTIQSTYFVYINSKKLVHYFFVLEKVKLSHFSRVSYCTTFFESLVVGEKNKQKHKLRSSNREVCLCFFT